MFKFLMEVGVIALLILTLFTQILIPIFVPKLDFFWVFKGKVKEEQVSTETPDVMGAINHLASDLKEKKEAFKASDKTISEAIHSLEDAKRD